MAKSKTRKGRRSGPARTLTQVAATRAGRNFIRMVVERADEGSKHRITIELEDESVSTDVHYDGKKATVADPRVSEFIMTSLASMRDAAITLETFEEEPEEGEEALRFIRCWLVEGGVFYPASAEDARSSALEGGQAEGGVFRDAFRLT